MLGFEVGEEELEILDFGVIVEVERKGFGPGEVVDFGENVDARVWEIEHGAQREEQR